MEYSVANRKCAKLVFLFFFHYDRGQSFLTSDTRYINMILVYKYDISRYFIGTNYINVTSDEDPLIFLLTLFFVRI